MKRGDAIRLIKTAGAARRARVTVHAREELENKNLNLAEQELQAALATAVTFEAQPNGRWAVWSDDFALHLIVLLTDGGEVLIWTVY